MDRFLAKTKNVKVFPWVHWIKRNFFLLFINYRLGKHLASLPISKLKKGRKFYKLDKIQQEKQKQKAILAKNKKTLKKEGSLLKSLEIVDIKKKKQMEKIFLSDERIKGRSEKKELNAKEEEKARVYNLSVATENYI